MKTVKEPRKFLYPRIYFRPQGIRSERFIIIYPNGQAEWFMDGHSAKFVTPCWNWNVWASDGYQALMRMRNYDELMSNDRCQAIFIGEIK